MGLESGGGGSSKKHKPRQDRRRTRKLLNQTRSGGVVSQKQLRRLEGIIRNSDAEGTLNTRDRIAVGNLLKQLDTKTKSSGNRTGSILGGPIMQNSNITQSKPYKSLQQYQVAGGKAGAKAQTNRDGKSYDNTKKNNGGLGTVIGKAAKAALAAQKKNNKNRPAAKSGGKKKGGKRGSQPWTQQGMSYYGVGDPPNVPRKEARVMVQQENNNLIRALLDQAGAFKQDLVFDKNSANALYDRTKGDLNYVFNEANDYIGNRSQAIDNTYNNLKGSVGDIFSGLQNTMQQTTDTNRNAALAEQARLGIQQSGMGNFDQDANFGMMQAQQQGANAQANLGLQQSAAAEIGNLLGSMSQASLASAVGRATNSRQDAITEAQQGYRSNINSIRNDISGIHKQTPQTVNELWEAMKNNSFQQYMEMQNADFQNQLAANSFNLDVSKMNSENFWKQREHAAQVAEARKRRQLAQQELAAQQESKRLYDSIKDVLNPVEYLFGS